MASWPKKLSLPSLPMVNPHTHPILCFEVPIPRTHSHLYSCFSSARIPFPPFSTWPVSTHPSEDNSSCIITMRLISHVEFLMASFFSSIHILIIVFIPLHCDTLLMSLSLMLNFELIKDLRLCPSHLCIPSLQHRSWLMVIPEKDAEWMNEWMKGRKEVEREGESAWEQQLHFRSIQENR